MQLMEAKLYIWIIHVKAFLALNLHFAVPVPQELLLRAPEGGLMTKAGKAPGQFEAGDSGAYRQNARRVTFHTILSAASDLLQMGLKPRDHPPPHVQVVLFLPARRVDIHIPDV